MKPLKCEMCGSANLIKQDGLFVCQSCGVKYSVEEARRMMIDGVVDVSGSTVKVDTSEELKNLYELARRAKADNNSTNAQKYYEQIIVKDSSNWEANFYTVYYQSMNCKIAEISIAALQVMNCEDTVFNLIKNNISDEDEQRKALVEVASNLINISNMLFSAYKNHYNAINPQIRGRFVQEYANTCSACRDIVYAGGDNIISVFGDKYGYIAAECWKLGILQHNVLNGVFKDKKGNAAIINAYNNKIKRYDSSYQPPRTNMTHDDGGCYVATCVYGSYDCPQVWTLRRYRDNILASTWYGRAFIRTYYAISPTLVKWFGNTQWFKSLWKRKLDKMVSNLRSNGIEDTPYQDKQWK